MLDGRGAHDAADQGGEEGGWSGFAADVAEDDGGAVGAVVDEVVEVAADGACGQKANGHFGVGMGGCGGRQQAELDLAGHGDIALQLALLAADGLVEAGIFDGDGDLGGEGGEDAHLLFMEEGGAGVFQVENADDAALVKERNDQLRAGFRVHGEVARVFADVGNIDGAPLADRSADQAFIDGKTAGGGVGVAKPPCVAGDEVFALFVEEHDGEHLVVDESAEELADALEERVEIEDGGQFDGNLIKDFKGLRLAGDAGVEAGVLNGLGDAGGGDGEQAEVLGTEVTGFFAFQIHDADEAVFGDERDSQLGADGGIDREVVLRGGDVVEQDGLTGKGHLADHALAEGDIHVFNVGDVTDLEAYAQFAGAVIEQKMAKMR